MYGLFTEGMYVCLCVCVCVLRSSGTGGMDSYEPIHGCWESQALWKSIKFSQLLSYSPTTMHAHLNKKLLISSLYLFVQNNNSQ